MNSLVRPFPDFEDFEDELPSVPRKRLIYLGYTEVPRSAASMANEREESCSLTWWYLHPLCPVTLHSAVAVGDTILHFGSEGWVPRPPFEHPVWRYSHAVPLDGKVAWPHVSQWIEEDGTLYDYDLCWCNCNGGTSRFIDQMNLRMGLSTRFKLWCLRRPLIVVAAILVAIVLVITWHHFCVRPIHPTSVAVETKMTQLGTYVVPTPNRSAPELITAEMVVCPLSNGPCHWLETSELQEAESSEGGDMVPSRPLRGLALDALPWQHRSLAATWV